MPEIARPYGDVERFHATASGPLASLTRDVLVRVT
jgi:hypothetical protein